MAYHNTGQARRKTLYIEKGDESHTYDLCAGFTDPVSHQTYPSISNEGFARLTEAEFNTRMRGFCNYVYSLHEGLEQDCPDIASSNVITDLISCPVKI